MGYLEYFLCLLLIIAAWALYKQRREISRLRRSFRAAEQKAADLEAQNQEFQYSLKRHNERKDFRVKLISMLVHDFRGAFTNIIALMDIYKRGEIPAENFSSLFEELKATCKENLEAFEHTLQWVKTQLDGYVFHPQMLPLSPLVRKVIKNNNSEIQRKRISLVLESDEEINVLADEKLLAFVLNSLINNAVKFSPVGGKVECRISRADRGGAIISVTDWGIGMDDRTLQSIFSHEKTIHTGTTGEKGAGIALIICKDFAEIQQAKLEVSSEKGKCTVFTVELSAGV